MHSAECIGKLSHSVKVADIDFGTVDVVYLTGGHGTCTDFVDAPAVKLAVESMFQAQKVVAAVCHVSGTRLGMGNTKLEFHTHEFLASDA